MTSKMLNTTKINTNANTNIITELGDISPVIFYGKIGAFEAERFRTNYLYYIMYSMGVFISLKIPPEQSTIKHDTCSTFFKDILTTEEKMETWCWDTFVSNLKEELCEIHEIGMYKDFPELFL